MPRYTQKQFQKDLKQLGGMINTFYRQNGGECPFSQSGGGKPTNNPNDYNVGYSMKQDNGKTWKVKEVRGKKIWSNTRRFKVVEVNGQKYDNDAPYKGADPKTGAKNAFKWICQRKNMKDESCKLTFTIKEVTRGSDKKTYGPYKGYTEKLDKPIVKMIKGQKIVTKYKRYVSLQK